MATARHSFQLYGAFPESSKESTVYCNYFCLVCLESFLVPLTCRALECQTILSQLQFAAATFLATRQLQTCLIHFGAWSLDYLLHLATFPLVMKWTLTILRGNPPQYWLLRKDSECKRTTQNIMILIFDKTSYIILHVSLKKKNIFSTPRFGISVNYALTQLQNTFVEKWSKIPNTKCNYTSLVEHTKKEPRNYSTDWRSILKYSSARSCYTLDLIFRTCLRAYVLLRIRWIQPVLDYMYIYMCVYTCRPGVTLRGLLIVGPTL